MTPQTVTQDTQAPTSLRPADGKVVTLRDAVREVESQFDAMHEQFAVALPPHINAKKFKSVVVTAINLNPELMRADRRSLWNACMKAAADGLMPDGREGALVIFNTKMSVNGKDAWVKAVQWMPMIAGIIKKIRQSGEVSSVGARIVYHNETISPGNDAEGNPMPPRFRYTIEDGEERVYHDPILFGDRGPFVGVYAYANFKDGTKEFEPLNKADIDKMRAVSRSSSKGPWSEWFEEMAKKSAIRRLSKRLPLTADIMSAVMRDDPATEIDAVRAEQRALMDQARVQLGAPAVLEYAPDAEALAWTEQLVANAVTGLAAMGTAADLDEFNRLTREMITEEPITDEDKVRLTGNFNAAYLERVRAIEKAKT